MVTTVNFPAIRKPYTAPEILELLYEDSLILCASVSVPELHEEPAPFEWE